MKGHEQGRHVFIRISKAQSTFTLCFPNTSMGDKTMDGCYGNSTGIILNWRYFCYRVSHEGNYVKQMLLYKSKQCKWVSKSFKVVFKIWCSLHLHLTLTPQCLYYKVSVMHSLYTPHMQVTHAHTQENWYKTPKIGHKGGLAVCLKEYFNQTFQHC